MCPCPTDVLGTGAFSVVKLATRRDGTELNAAVKVVERRALGRGDLENLRGEAALLRELDHPNIIKLYGWFEEEHTLYMALELCEGKQLARWCMLAFLCVAPPPHLELVSGVGDVAWKGDISHGHRIAARRDLTDDIFSACIELKLCGK